MVMYMWVLGGVAGFLFVLWLITLVELGKKETESIGKTHLLTKERNARKNNDEVNTREIKKLDTEVFRLNSFIKDIFIIVYWKSGNHNFSNESMVNVKKNIAIMFDNNYQLQKKSNMDLATINRLRETIINQKKEFEKKENDMENEKNFIITEKNIIIQKKDKYIKKQDNQKQSLYSSLAHYKNRLKELWEPVINKKRK